MEGTIKSFKIWSGSIPLKKRNTNFFIESPKGFFGISLKTSSSTNPYFCKVKSPSYCNLLWLKESSKNLDLADLITLIGTIDVVFGEVDR